MKKSFVLLALLLVALAVGVRATLVSTSSGFVAPITDSLVSSSVAGRYQIVPGQVDGSFAIGIHVILKIDTATGRTWALVATTNACTWNELEDLDFTNR